MKPKIVFITKSLCYHQVGIADKLYSNFGDDFAFIQMREPLPFRVENKQEGFKRDYLMGYSKDDASREKCIDALNNAKVIIWGEASLKILKNIKNDVIILKYSERIFKKGFYKSNFIHYLLNCINLLRLKSFLHNKNSYLLSAGAYSSSDYNRFGLFKGRSLRWGYFPLFDNKEKNIKRNNKAIKLIWVNRLLKWKHPEFAIYAAEILKKNAIDFSLDIVGDGDLRSGEMKQKIAKMISKHHLSDSVHMLGKVEPKKVLDLYKDADVALFTSGPAEGWGVGLSEAMNSGCLSISSDKMGSTKYLINDGKNGFIYKFNNKTSFVNVVLNVCSNVSSLNEVRKNAISTIDNIWSCEEATERLSNIIEQLLSNGVILKYPDDGPCSLIRGK